MRRLSRVITGRLREERGAVAVFVALGMTVLLGFAALSIDTAAATRDHQVLRNAADAAALGVALDCANAVPADTTTPGSRPAPLPSTCPASAESASTVTATGLVTANAGSGTVVTTVLSGRSVTVTVTAPASRPIPIGPGTITVTSRAVWTPATISFAASYPLAISYCRYLRLPAATPSRLAAEPTGLWLLPARQEINPAAWTGNDSCTGPESGSRVSGPTSVMTRTDAGAACGTTSSRGNDVTGQTFERVTFASRTCVASSQFGNVTSWPHGGYQIVVPVYDRVSGDQYRVWDYLGFHVQGITAEGGLWGFSTGLADRALGTPVPPSVRLTVTP